MDNITIGRNYCDNFKNSGIDLFVTSAKPEYDFIKNNYGYSESFLGSVIYRYDETTYEIDKRPIISLSLLNALSAIN